MTNGLTWFSNNSLLSPVIIKSSASVSYTHLVETDGMFLGIGKIHAVLTFGLTPDQLAKTLVAVSYTHLDVYKRQAIALSF